MAKVKKKRRARRSPEERAKILAAAQKEGLTATDVQKRFGVTPVTYYSWRKKSGAPKRSRRRKPQAARNGVLGSQVRGAVENRMRDLLPKLVEREINRYLDATLGSGSRKGR